MDPNAAYEEIKRIMARIESNTDKGRVPLAPSDASRLVDLWDGLDGWLKSRGFLPDAWKGGR